MSKKVFITSALPYCNNVPHLGNIIGSTLSADVYSRFKKTQNCDTIYLCGVDCYGTTTELRAHLEGLSCEEICEKYMKLHKRIYDWFNIKFDVWGQTNTKQQTKITHKIFLELYKNGYIEEKTIMQMYCSNCDKFLADRYLKGTCYHKECDGKNNITNGDQCDNCQKFIDVNQLINPFCHICKKIPYMKETHHLYLKLNELHEEINNYNFNNQNVKLSNHVISITKSWLNNGLESRCITRDLKWGTPIPWEFDDTLAKYKNKVFYVWFDAPFGYYSILMQENIDYDDWLKQDTEMVQFMGKDNVVFHTIIFPGSIIGSKLDLPLVNKLGCTEYLLYGGKKFSKSDNIGIFGDQVEQISNILGISEDYWRYYLLKIRPETSDSSFDWKDFIMTIQSDLVNNIGNFINRCVTMSEKLCNNVTHYKNDDMTEILNLINNYNDLFENFKFKEALNQCLILSNYGNTYLQKEKPWVIAKNNSDESKEMLQNILGKANLICYVLLKLLNPIIPNTSLKLLNTFNFTNQFDDLTKIIINNNIITINKSNYSLPFKNLNIKEVKIILEKFNILSTL